MGNEAIAKDFDVVVVGGGAAGIAAAVGAAQSGVTVCLIEQYGFLGGAATNSSVLTHCGFFDQMKRQVVAGVGQQVLDGLANHRIYRTQTFEPTGNTVVLLDLETTKSVFDEMVIAAGVHLMLHCQVISASLAGGLVTSVETVHRGGRCRINARSFVDCSGDGALLSASSAAAAVSAAEQRQASTLVIRMGGVPEDADLSSEGILNAVRAYQDQTGGSLPRETGVSVRMPITREVMLLFADQHGDALDVDELTQAEIQGRQLSWKYLAAFTQFLPGWSDSYISSTGPQIGIRETRRLRGVETVRAGDVSSGRTRPLDAIARCGWPMEDHSTPGMTKYERIKDRGWYHIPYGAICSDSVPNLWAGGRLVSSDRRAYASLRVMGTSFATGHACGVASAVYAQTGHHDYPRTRRLLQEQGALI
jgi:hypothetical protein